MGIEPKGYFQHHVILDYKTLNIIYTNEYKPEFMNTNRRDFIRQLSLACGSVLFITSCDGYESPWRFFTEKEAQTLIAFAEQIIPGDKDPGATEANVINFIDKQMVNHYIRFQNEYRSGIMALEESARKLHNKLFYELDTETQITFMEQMEAGSLPADSWQEIGQQQFFNMLLDHSMQGFYGSPRHGGNKNYVSYKMIKLDYPHIIGQNRYNTESVSGKTHVQ